MQHLQAAAESEEKKHGNFDRQGQAPETGTGDAVVRCPLVCRQRDTVGELRWYRVAVFADMRRVARAQPQA